MKELNTAFDFKGQELFLEALSGSLCNKPITMQQLSDQLHKTKGRMEGKRLLLLWQKIPPSCGSSKLGPLWCFIKLAQRLFKVSIWDNL